jgi:predicted alpha/beta superfamily hydrolase
MSLKSTVLGEERIILVRTPPGYETNDVKYPVLYMTDGDAHMGHTASTIEFLTRSGRISDLIVVGVTNTDRTRDLTPAISSYKNAAGELRFPTSGGADNFLKFFQTELIPEIEKEYRVQPYRIFAGHSLGGLFAIHAMMTKPGLFNSYVAVSPSLQWENFEALKRAEDFLKNQKELNVTLFVSLGNEPGAIGESFDKFREALAKSNIKGFEWQAERMSDEDHGSVVLRSHYFGLRKVYADWQAPRDQKSGAVLGGLKGVDAHYAKLSGRFGYSIPTPEGLINQIGYQYCLTVNLKTRSPRSKQTSSVIRNQRTFTTVLPKLTNKAGVSISRNRFTRKRAQSERRTTIRMRLYSKRITNEPIQSW